ncbi:nuclear transport factor 2 family protein [Nocardia seriolae]|nr:nuclear transport factor 2 family protein [Nocardia seriolae]MTJ66117.1 hypothetical protein [Nocardia seriolae]MTJ75865.1 hypothetical protein [Nocardia seriolae]MTJ85967.1 hypothetical protein [Nocardia seriolae]MTK29961.1 hypothetical protein [Nocardia seriolae]MTK44111.1 hypothetical protein [Nocardia seriolae]
MSTTPETRTVIENYIRAMLARFDTTAPITQEVHGVLADGDRAVAEWTTRATTAAGEEYVNDVVITFRVTGGRIAEAREHFDTAYAARLLFNAG